MEFASSLILVARFPGTSAILPPMPGFFSGTVVTEPGVGPSENEGLGPENGKGAGPDGPGAPPKGLAWPAKGSAAEEGMP
ncbi:MAG: hypothetical protein A4E24_00905 [Methanomethylovorans sp. PtaU1.Bin093]|nr:MAG: hypothetical protein A4E24_00905 [Methanomethylovorans sp. PtaU1.Bin093]